MNYKKQTIALLLLCAGSAFAADIYKTNIYTKAKDNVGPVSASDKAVYDGYSTKVPKQNVNPDGSPTFETIKIKTVTGVQCWIYADEGKNIGLLCDDPVTPTLVGILWGGEALIWGGEELTWGGE